MNRFTSLLALMCVLIAAPLFAQTERLTVNDGAMVEVHHTKDVNVHLVARHADGTQFAERWVHNLRTTGGADWQTNSMSATSGRPAAANYIAMSNDATTPAAGDCAAGSSTCTLTAEIVSNGLQRAQATYAHSNGTNSYTLTLTFTATGTQAAQKAGVFNAGASGTMVFEAAFTPVSLANGDTVTVTWTVSC